MSDGITDGYRAAEQARQAEAEAQQQLESHPELGEEVPVVLTRLQVAYLLDRLWFDRGWGQGSDIRRITETLPLSALPVSAIRAVDAIARLTAAYDGPAISPAIRERLEGDASASRQTILHTP